MTDGWWQSATGVVELCDECGFDSGETSDLVRGVAAVYADLEELNQNRAAARRPGHEVWSGSEYIDHCTEVSRYLLGLVSRATGREPRTTIGDLQSARAAAGELLPHLSRADYTLVVPADSPLTVTVRWAVVHLLHDLRHHALDVRRGYARLAMSDLEEVHVYRR